MSDRVSDQVERGCTLPSSRAAGPRGEREKVYTCTYRSPTLMDHPITSGCFAIVDGRVYSVSADPC